MKKIVLFYFSGTGNTWWAAIRLAGALRDSGAAYVSTHSIEEVSPKDAESLIAGADAVGFGYPVYGSDVPEVMKGFMRGLKPAGKDTFIFCTQWLWSGDGARVATEFLHTSFRVMWAEHVSMPNNVSVTVLRLPYTNHKGRISRHLKKAEKRIKAFARRILSGRPFLRGFNPVSVFSGYLQRGPFRRMFGKLRDDISINGERCIGCGDCVRYCPSGNLFFEEGAVQTRGTCILCLRCYSFCPVMAVEYMGRAHQARRGEPYRGPVEEFSPNLIFKK